MEASTPGGKTAPYLAHRFCLLGCFFYAFGHSKVYLLGWICFMFPLQLWHIWDSRWRHCDSQVHSQNTGFRSFFPYVFFNRFRSSKTIQFLIQPGTRGKYIFKIDPGPDLAICKVTNFHSCCSSKKVVSDVFDQCQTKKWYCHHIKILSSYHDIVTISWYFRGIMILSP